MKISYYGLLKMIDESSAPKEVKYNDMFFERSNGNYRYWDTSKLHFLSDYFSMEDMLKDEIEILDNEDEEKGLPEKVSLEIDKFEDSYYDTALIKVAGAVDGIIDYLEKQRKGE